MSCCSRALTLAAATALLGCSPGVTSDLAPHPTQVTPAAGANDADVAVTIVGTNFLARASQGLGGGGVPVPVDDRFTAWLGDTPLAGVARVDDRHLAATVPKGLAVGRYDLRVVGPYGSAGTLAGAYEAVAGHPLLGAQLVAVDAAIAVGDTAQLTLTLTNEGPRALDDVTLLLDPPSGGVLGAPVVPVPLSTLAPGASSTAAVTAGALAIGTAHLTGHVTARDAATGEAVSVPVAVDEQVFARGALAGQLVAGPSPASVGQLIDLALTVTDTAGTGAIQVAPSSPVTSGSGQVSLVAAPPAADVPAGGSTTFHYSYRAAAPGDVVFTASAAGVDAETGKPIAVPPQSSAPVTIQAAAALVGTLGATPVLVGVGGTIQLSLTVRNQGGARALGVAPDALTPSGAGAATLAGASVQPVDLDGGASHTFQWSLAATGTGDLSFATTARATDANAQVAIDTGLLHAGPVTIGRAAALSVSCAASPATLSVGQTGTLSITVENAGAVDASGVTTSAIASGSGALSLANAPAATTIGAGGSVTLQRSFTATMAGSVTLACGAQGTDASSGAAVTASGASSNALTLQRPPSLGGSAQANPSQVASGQTLNLQLLVHNGGDATAVAVTPQLPSVGGSANAALVASPSPADIAGGQTASFVWSYKTSGPGGTLTFATAAEGRDANTGAVVATGPVDAPAATVLPPAKFSGAATLSPSVVSVGQTLTFQLVISNSGSADATSTTPTTPQPSGTGAATLLSSPSPQTVPKGGSAAFTFTYRATVAGTLSLSAGASGTDAGSGMTVTATPAISNAVTVQRPAALATTLVAAPSTVNLGQPFTLTLHVTNGGDATAKGVTPSAPVPSGAGAATLTSGPSPALADIAGGASQDFVFQYGASGTGSLTFAAGASGSDGNSAQPVATSATSNGLTVERRASLSSSWQVPSAVDTGQTFPLTLHVTNGGDAAANVVVPQTPIVMVAGSASAQILGGPVPPSATIAGGQTQPFTFTVKAGSGGGSLSFSDAASGTDAVDGQPAAAAAVTSPAVPVVAPAALTATLAAPATVGRGASFTVTLTVQNGGGAPAASVIPAAPSVGGGIAIQSGPSPASVASLAAGATATFTFTALAQTPGAATISDQVAASDGNSGGSLSAIASTALTIVEAQQVLANPFSDGTAFAYVFGFAGEVYLGPRANGQGMVRANPDGSSLESVSIAIPRGASMANSATAPFPSVGATGCTHNTLACGPDNEDGRALVRSVDFYGAPWLFLTGARSSGNEQFVYMTQDTSTSAAVSYVNYVSVDQGGSQDVSAVDAIGNVLYLGLLGQRPQLIALHTAPSYPGFVGAKGSDLFDLAAQNMPSVGVAAKGPGIVGIEAMADLNGLLYLANNGGCERSNVAAPAAYGTNAGDWADCTPTASPWTALSPLQLPASSDLTPADKATPAMVAFQGRLYLARNTTTGPQLWGCDATRTGAANACDPGDWFLVAPNTQGDARLSQFDDAGSTRITLLAATPSHLYVGYDNAAGAVLFRSTGAAPTGTSDFEGALGCSAANHPSSCAGLGGAGLGATANTRLFDGVALPFNGQDWIYVVAGDGTAAVRVYRIAG